jgi:hypothetical protein
LIPEQKENTYPMSPLIIIFQKAAEPSMAFTAGHASESEQRSEIKMKGSGKQMTHLVHR